MAQKVHVILEDDLDGSEASETIRFGLDGSQYEIDLNNDNAKEFRKTLERYASAGRRIKQSRQRRTRQPGEAVS
jgi:hypothetical protein